MTPLLVDAGIATRPLPGEASGACGDMGLLRPTANGLFAAMIDGLGHGVLAQAVAREACDHLNQVDPDAAMDLIMLSLQKKLRGGRGCVAALCRVNAADGLLEFCGLGDIVTRTLGATSKIIVPQDGIIGQVAPKPRVQQQVMAADSVLVMHSDGISSRIYSSELEWLLQGEPKAAAERLVATFGRDSDDAGCVVIRVRA
ncbi:SpoIIE family protein phosphatase [Halomonas aquatica]|uniref:SpoIIE family protein phosphatase n=1 Tax=Halomonas aquatica TaxID=3151123 RepID=A0ABV1NBE5_9GAMM